MVRWWQSDVKQWSCSSCTVMVMERDECVYTLSAQLDKNGYQWGKWRAGRLFSFKSPTGGTTPRFLLRLKILLIGLMREIQFKRQEAYFREVNSVFKGVHPSFPVFFPTTHMSVTSDIDSCGWAFPLPRLQQPGTVEGIQRWLHSVRETASVAASGSDTDWKRQKEVAFGRWKR